MTDVRAPICVRSSPNRCAVCIGTVVPDVNYADTGLCGECGASTDVYDLDLIDLYTGAGFSAHEVWRLLPRIRGARVAGLNADAVSMADVGRALRVAILEARSSSLNPPRS